MGFFSSIQAKVAAISATAYSAYHIVKMLPERLEAFNEGNYVEAFLGEKWAKVLNPDAYAGEDTKETETEKEIGADAHSSELEEAKNFDVELSTSAYSSDAKQTRDPSLQAETDALAALGDTSVSTELSYGG